MKIKDAIITSGIPPNESRILLSHALECSLEYLLINTDKEIDESEYLKLVARRRNHEPIAYIIGKKEFYSREFIVSPDVLIPRPDSEVMMDAIINSSLKANSILELGTGSGCLLLTLLLEMPSIKGEGVDISDESIKIATQNMEKFDLSNRCKIYKSNWFEKVEGRFDIIISNPPYINKDDQTIMAKETILHEPESALYGEEKGLADYKKIAESASKFLNPKGRIFLEIGIGQKDDVVRIFEEDGFVLESAHKDLSGVDRVISLVRH